MTKSRWKLMNIVLIVIIIFSILRLVNGFMNTGDVTIGYIIQVILLSAYLYWANTKSKYAPKNRKNQETEEGNFGN